MLLVLKELAANVAQIFSGLAGLGYSQAQQTRGLVYQLIN